MKKIISIFVPAVAAMILAASCNKIQETPAQPAAGEQITIKASIPEATKVEYEANTEKGRLHRPRSRIHRHRRLRLFLLHPLSRR